MKQDKEKLLKQKENDFKEMRAYRKQFENKWKEYRAFYDGKHWKNNVERPVKNLIFSLIEAETSILTDSRPGTAVLPLESQYEDKAKVLESAIEAVYEHERMQLKIAQGIRDSLIEGPSWLAVDYDFNAMNGLGMPTIDNLPWPFVYVDQTANEIDKATRCIIRRPVDIEELKMKYPKSKDVIKVTKIDNNDTIISDGRRPDVARIYDDKGEDVGRYDSERMTIEETYYCKDYSMEKISSEETTKEIIKENDEIIGGVNPEISKYEDHQKHYEGHNELIRQVVAEALGVEFADLTDRDIEAVMAEDQELGLIILIAKDHIKMHEVMIEENPNAEKPKYKNFWRVSVWNGTELLEDGAPEVEDGMIPLSPIYAYKTTSNIYGEGEVKNIIDSQKSFNDVDYAQYQNLLLNGNSGWMLDNNSGVDHSTLTNDPGIIIEKNQGTEVSRIQPGIVSPELQNRKMNDQSDMEVISGINEITQGRRPTGVTAAAAIQSLQDQSVGRMRLKSRNLDEYTMPRLGKLIMSRILKYWTVERKLRVYDKNGQLKFIQYKPEDLQSIEFDVRPVPGSTAGLNKETIFILFERLLQEGVIDKRTFVEAVDIPYKAKVIESMDKQDEMTQMLAMLQEENAVMKQQLGIEPVAEGQ